MVLALASSIGLHWAFFQSVAWMGMVITYSQETTVKEALAKTFDGRHPCPLCKEIAKSKKSEKKSEFSCQVKKLDFLTQTARFIFSPPTAFWRMTGDDLRLTPVCRTPPTPPPRAAFV